MASMHIIFFTTELYTLHVATPCMIVVFLAAVAVVEACKFIPKITCGYSCIHLGKYGHTLHVWNWKEHTPLQDIDLGDDGMIPLELRFLHNPDATEGYVACTLSSNIMRFYKNEVW